MVNFYLLATEVISEYTIVKSAKFGVENSKILYFWVVAKWFYDSCKIFENIDFGSKNREKVDFWPKTLIETLGDTFIAWIGDFLPYKLAVMSF